MHGAGEEPEAVGASGTADEAGWVGVLFEAGIAARGALGLGERDRLGSVKLEPLAPGLGDERVDVP
jgi:hypothetical protein